MFTVAREMRREDDLRTTMNVHVGEDFVEVSYSLEGKQNVETKRYTPLEMDMLLDLLTIAHESAAELNT